MNRTKEMGRERCCVWGEGKRGKEMERKGVGLLCVESREKRGRKGKRKKRKGEGIWK
jgi:hypothetical protein